MEGFSIAQLIYGIDNTILFIILALTIILIPAALLLKKAMDARSEKGRARRQRLDYQPTAKPSWIAIPIPISKRFPKQQPVSAPGHDADLLENCQDIQQSLLALAGKYSLDSFTIATSDGLVFASSGGSKAQEDAARYNQKDNVSNPEGVALFSLDHKGSELTGIIRPQGVITRETLKRIENDTQDILNRWI